MKINIENYLHQIDTSFKEKAKKDIYMTYVIIFSVIFAFSYLLFWESSEKGYKQINAQIAAVTVKINDDKRFLQLNPESKIVRLDQEIKNAEAELIVYKDNNAYIKTKIETIAYLIYDERTWGEYLHSISINAKKYDMMIIDFTNKYALNNQSFGHILDIEVKSTGNYKNTLNFINSLEQSELVVDIHDLDINAKDSLNSDLKISVWGITY
jgi:hypothetical protein